MSYKAHIDKNEISAMPTVAFEGRIITIDTPQAVDQAIRPLKGEPCRYRHRDAPIIPQGRTTRCVTHPTLDCRHMLSYPS